MKRGREKAKHDDVDDTIDEPKIKYTAKEIEESNNRFKLYIKKWNDEVENEGFVRPSALPPLSAIETITTPRHRVGEEVMKVVDGIVHVANGKGERALVPGASTSLKCRGTGITTDERMLQHFSADPNEMERPLRLSSTLSHLKSIGLLDKCFEIASRMVKTKELRLVHNQAYIDHINQIDFVASLKEEKSFSVDQDIYASQGTVKAARLSAGCVVQAAVAVVDEVCANAFAIIRPPGHHAGVENASGFCIFNNVAVAARVAQQRLAERGKEDPKIMILDWDVHHCDGTENIFYNDPSVLVVSIHQYGNKRGHVLRKTPTVVFDTSGSSKPPQASDEILNAEELDALMADTKPNADSEKNPSELKMKEEIHKDEENKVPTHENNVSAEIPAETGEGSGRRPRKAIDYDQLEKELKMTDEDVLAMFGAKASPSSSSSSSSSSEESSPSGEGGKKMHLAGDTPGQSFDSWSHREEEETYYPGTGHLGNVGGEEREEAKGKNINIPWPAHGFGDLEYLQILEEVIIPAGKEFEPDLVMISCGFDSARGDLLGNMSLTPSGYYCMTARLCEHFPKLVVALEGGYNVANVAKGSESVLRALLKAGQTTDLPPSRMLWCQTRRVAEEVKKIHSPFWDCFREAKK